MGYFRRHYAARVTRREWYEAGGLANPSCFRRFVGDRWLYYILHD